MITRIPSSSAKPISESASAPKNLVKARTSTAPTKKDPVNTRNVGVPFLCHALGNDPFLITLISPVLSGGITEGTKRRMETRDRLQEELDKTRSATASMGKFDRKLANEKAPKRGKQKVRASFSSDPFNSFYSCSSSPTESGCGYQGGHQRRACQESYYCGSHVERQRRFFERQPCCETRTCYCARRGTPSQEGKTLNLPHQTCTRFSPLRLSDFAFLFPGNL